MPCKHSLLHGGIADRADRAPDMFGRCRGAASLFPRVLDTLGGLAEPRDAFAPPGRVLCSALTTLCRGFATGGEVLLSLREAAS